MSQGPGPCACGRIDVHAHFLPECYVAALAKAGLKTLDGGFPVPAWSAGAALETMDRQKIDTAMISLSSPSTHFLPVEEKPRLVRDVNTAGGELVRSAPGRFGFFASLPLPDVDAALREIAHAFDTLGADGIVLETNITGEYLGSPRFAPVFAELNRRKAVVFLHPTSPACLDALWLGRPAPLLEFPLDTTRTIVDLLYTRTLQTNPDIRVIVPHGGAALPALVARIAAFANVPFIEPRPQSEQEVFETLGRLYYDVALSAHPVPLAALRRLAPIGQILFGSDWPFTPEMGVARNIHQLDTSPELNADDARAIARENAERLFPRLGR
ncbi:MAG TPA: amidohydrolase family protein [Rhizomicrobium sp.]|jgi:predicted TIM-barrel fold metal-dependent hydrolase|nr:amidohydrolase family protein [Rhizomicrobium sp.]